MQSINSLFLSLFSILMFVSTTYAGWENKVYKMKIKTAYCHRLDEPMSPPLIELHSGEQLTMEFDDLAIEQSNYSYRIIHCTWDWETSKLYETNNAYNPVTC